MTSKIKVSASIIASNMSNLQKVLADLEKSGVDYVHVDVMDANFVPNLTIGPLVIKAMRAHTKKVFDTHLMICDPGKYISEYAEAGCDIIGIHEEIKSNKIEILKRIRSFGKRSCIVFNPDTSVERIEEYFPHVDQVLLMSVFPGFSGQKFIPTALARGREVREKIEKSGLPIDLQIDGGVGEDNCGEVIKSGFNVLVTGSALFKSKDMEKTVLKLKQG